MFLCREGCGNEVPIESAVCINCNSFVINNVWLPPLSPGAQTEELIQREEQLLHRVRTMFLGKGLLEVEDGGDEVEMPE